MTNSNYDHTVLIIDDEDFILSSINRLLRQEFKVLLANSAHEGLQLMKEEEVHVVVTDQRMPGMMGVEFLGKVKGEYPDAIRMLLTGYSDLESVISAVNAGNIYRYLVKPWDPDEFLAVIREACVKYDLLAKNQQLTQELTLANAELEKRVQERTARLARTSNLITELNHTAIRLQSNLDYDQLKITLQVELQKLHLESIVLIAEKLPKDIIRPQVLDEKITEEHTCLEVIAAKMMHKDEKGEFFIHEYIPDMQAWSQRLITQCEDGVPEFFAALKEIPAEIFGAVLPLYARQGFVGVLFLWGADLEEDDLVTYIMFANQVALGIENAVYFETLKTLAETDGLTGLLNRHAIIKMAEREFRRAKRLQDDMAVIMIDVDRFKQINDTYGHAIGDQALRFIAKTMDEALRKDVDAIGRYGGDEFLVLLPCTGYPEAASIATRLRQNVENQQVPFLPGLGKIQISVGTAVFDENIPNLDKLMDLADQEMYAFKNERKQTQQD